MFRPLRLPSSVTVKPYFSRIGAIALVLTATLGSAEESHVEARLVADAATIEAGRPFLLGVLLEPESGWHVYWRNPGEAGLATEVVFDLPADFEAGELQWPAPVAFEQPGGLAGIGYEEPVVLAAEISAPDRLPAATPVTVNAFWLACKDVCILGSAELRAVLPLEGDELDVSKAALAKWSETLPMEAEPSLFDLSVTGGPVPGSGPADLVVWLNWKKSPGTIEAFPDPGPGLKVESVRAQTRGLLTRIDLRVSRLKTSSAPAETLRSLIVIEDERGNRSARIVRIEID